MAVTRIPAEIDGIEIEIEVPIDPGTQPTARRMPGDRFRSMLPEAEEVIGKFAVVAARIAKQVADQAGKPDQLELQFGVKFSAQGKIVLGSASAEGNISVKVIYGSAARVEFEAQDSVDVKDVVE